MGWPRVGVVCCQLIKSFVLYHSNIFFLLFTSYNSKTHIWWTLKNGYIVTCTIGLQGKWHHGIKITMGKIKDPAWLGNNYNNFTAEHVTWGLSDWRLEILYGWKEIKVDCVYTNFNKYYIKILKYVGLSNDTRGSEICRITSIHKTYQSDKDMGINVCALLTSSGKVTHAWPTYLLGYSWHKQLWCLQGCC